MTDVARSAPPAPKAPNPPTHTQTHTHPSTPASRSPAGKGLEEGGDVFSALLSLVAQTRDIQTPPASETPAHASGEPASETAPSTAQDSSHHPLAQWPGWADPRTVAERATPGAAQRALAAPGNSPQALPAGGGAGGGTGGGTGLDITGMQPLADPQAIDPATVSTGAQIDPNLADLNLADAQPGVTPQAAQETATTSTPAGRSKGAVAPTPDNRASNAPRDARAHAHAATAAAQSTTSAGLRAPTTGWQPMANASVRAAAPAGSGEAARARSAGWGHSTVSMDLSSSRAADGVAGNVASNAVSLTARLSAVLAGQASGADGAANLALPGATPEASASTTEGSPAAERLPQDAPALDAEPTQIGHWSTQQLRHAHLRLGEGALDSVDIRLSMQGQELSVDFRTDNADVRQSLAQQANQSLAALLERSGIALADVSVGAQQHPHQPQHQPGGQHSEPQRERTDPAGRSRAAARVPADASMALHALPAQALRSDGSRPLDLFV